MFREMKGIPEPEEIKEPEEIFEEEDNVGNVVETADTSDDYFDED